MDKKIIFFLFSLCLTASNSWAQSGKSISLLEPEGDFKVGTKSFLWTDEQSEEIATPETGDTREFYVQVWYPASEVKGLERKEYMPSLNEFGEMVSENFTDRMSRIQTNSYENASLSEEQDTYYLELFSPGFGMSKYYYTMLFEHLASNGYIVAAIDFPYLNKLVDKSGIPINPEDKYWHSFPAAGAAEGTYEEAEDKLRMTEEYFSEGQLFVLNKIQANSFFADKINDKKIVSAGHSAGALGVKGLMSAAESPFSAFITYDVSIHQVIGARDIIVPHINNTKNPILMFVLEYASLPGYDFVNNLNTDIEIHVFSDMSHNTLSDLDYLYYKDEGMTEEVDQTKINLDKIFSGTLEFLDQEMNNSN